MLRLVLASLTVILFVGDASACHRQPARRLARALVPHRVGVVHRERHVVRERTVAAPAVAVKAPCTSTGCAPAPTQKK